jgi:uncharacterized lipoprotein YmbA
MTDRFRHALAVGLVLGLALVLALTGSGCLGRSPQLHHFMLGVAPLAPAEVGAPDVSVLIGPVRLPAYLVRPELARLGADGEIDLDDDHRWLGSFEENFLRATSLGVAQRLGATRVVTHPSKAPFPIEYTVRLHVDDFIAEAGGTMRVRIRWALVGPAGRGTGPLDAPPTRLFVLEEKREGVGRSAEARVRAYEAVLGELATRIAAAIVEAETGEGGASPAGAS